MFRALNQTYSTENKVHIAAKKHIHNCAVHSSSLPRLCSFDLFWNHGISRHWFAAFKHSTFLVECFRGLVVSMRPALNPAALHACRMESYATSFWEQRPCMRSNLFCWEWGIHYCENNIHNCAFYWRILARFHFLEFILNALGLTAINLLDSEFDVLGRMLWLLSFSHGRLCNF